ncbi:hypothetical protein ABT143_11560 [Streptomyces sp. NPDC002033]|uniref:hypothetical protein n=1 Tax=unclassified Streptomyces TaxID=2593676 RepID=UPI003318E8BA
MSPGQQPSMPVAGIGPAAEPQGPAADLLVRNAKVFTGDPARPEARAVAVRDGRVLALGADDHELAAFVGPATRVVDALGRRVVPGLNEEYAVRPLFAHLRAVVAPTSVFAAPEDWGAGGDGPRHALADRVVRAAGELAALMSGSGRAVAAEEEVVPFEQRLAALRTDRP